MQMKCTAYSGKWCENDLQRRGARKPLQVGSSERSLLLVLVPLSSPLLEQPTLTPLLVCSACTTEFGQTDEHAGTWERGHTGSQAHGSMGTQEHGTQVCSHTGAQAHRNMGTREHRNMGAWAHGSSATQEHRPQGSTGAWEHRHTLSTPVLELASEVALCTGSCLACPDVACLSPIPALGT